MKRFTITAEQRWTYVEPENCMESWLWAVKQFGEPGHQNWSGGRLRWSFDTLRTFTFADEKDYILFALRWA